MSTQIRSLAHKRRILGATYADKVMDTGPVAYWPLDERTGTVAHCLVDPAQNGTYTGVTLANDSTNPVTGTAAPYFDGANDVANIFSTAFIAAFDGAEGSYQLWLRVANAGVWTDATERWPLTFLADGNNYIAIKRPTTNDRINYMYRAGGTTQSVALTPYSPTTWFCMLLTWSASAGVDGEVKAYLNGAQTGLTQTGLGAWAGVPGGAQTCIGAFTTAPANVWHGWLQHCAIWDRALTPAEITPLANV